MLIVVIIGIVLLMLNVCACAAVVYQKNRVRQREDNLRRRIKRLSDAGMIRPPGPSECNDLEQQPRTYCVSSSHENGCNHDQDSTDADNSDADSADHDTHVALQDNNVYVITRPMISDVSYEEFRTSSLQRYSRSMGNNLNAIPYHQNASKNIAALDVLPPNAMQNVIQKQPQQPPRRPPQNTDSVCYSLKSRFGHNDTASSSAGSRPPSPIIEVIPVSEYESLYGKMRPPQQQQPPQPQPIFRPLIHHHPQFTPTGVVYPVYNNGPMSSTLPMSSSSASRHFDYAPRGNFAPQMQLPRPQTSMPPSRPTNHWGTLQHPQPPRPASGLMQQPQMTMNLQQQSSYPRHLQGQPLHQGQTS